MHQVDSNKKKSKKSTSKAKVKGKVALKSSGKKVPDSKVRNSIIKALSHNEAEDGLYFRNFFLLHEEDQRPGVKATTKEILQALNQLLVEGLVRVDYDDLDVTFRLSA